MIEPVITPAKHSIAEIKQMAEKFPEPVRSDILQAPNEMSHEEFLIRFISWRRQLRVLQTMEDR